MILTSYHIIEIKFHFQVSNIVYPAKSFQEKFFNF